VTIDALNIILLAIIEESEMMGRAPAMLLSRDW
jgi:hypothetical protein